MGQNYRVVSTYFGAYGRGDVIPEHEVTIGHRLETLIAGKVVEPTDHPINVELRPRPAPVARPDEDATAERNRLFKENLELKAKLEDAVKQGAEIARQRDHLKGKIADQTLEVEHLKAACADHQKANDVLAARVKELEAVPDKPEKPGKAVGK